MQRITWCTLLAAVALAAPISGQRQAQQPQMPRANVRELATIEAEVNEFVRIPTGRAVIYSAKVDGGVATFTYDIATKRSTLLGTNMEPASVSPLGDRLALRRSSVDRSGDFLWTMPIDPRTGVATGQAQRVSLRPTRSRPIFSPDGKTLAFQAGPRPDGTGTGDITIVPATGGVERIVANVPRRVWLGWSADGTSLYVERGDDNPKTAIERVAVTGGASAPSVPRTQITNKMAVGLSPDARVAFFTDNPDRFFYRTASGIEGEIAVALAPLDDAWGFDLTLDSTLRYTTMTYVQHQGVRVLDLTTGKARDLLPSNLQSNSPVWSPDGRRLAVLTGNRSHYDITVVNADGSSPRRYQAPMQLTGWDRSWSPDGRFLAFRMKDQPKVGDNPADQHQLGLLDVTSGQTRVLTTSSMIGQFVWRSDGNAIRALKRTFVAIGSPTLMSIVEIPLSGPERLLRDISTEFPRANDVVFISDRAVAVRVATDKGPERFFVPLDGGAGRRLPDPGAEPGTRIGNGTLVAGNRLLVGQIDARGEAWVIKILSTVGDATRTLPIPFNGHHGVLHPDGTQIINVGKAAGDSVWKLFLVPLDGSSTRVVGEIPSGTGGLLAPSPDGKLVAYTSDGRVTSKIHEIDFGPALQAIEKR